MLISLFDFWKYRLFLFLEKTSIQKKRTFITAMTSLQTYGRDKMELDDLWTQSVKNSSI